MGAYVVAHAFFSVYNMAIDTIFLCFCEYNVKQLDLFTWAISIIISNIGIGKHMQKRCDNYYCFRCILSCLKTDFDSGIFNTFCRTLLKNNVKGPN